MILGFNFYKNRKMSSDISEATKTNRINKQIAIEIHWLLNRIRELILNPSSVSRDVRWPIAADRMFLNLKICFKSCTTSLQNMSIAHIVKACGTIFEITNCPMCLQWTYFKRQVVQHFKHIFIFKNVFCCLLSVIVFPLVRGQCTTSS